ncbi:MAG: hypothetical protein D6758_03140 [Gammaproteobacteria bacterium]|nr:MAG: hypothetical protein D6758_03140 [Gammaproteobacteria bacterium]
MVAIVNRYIFEVDIDSYKNVVRQRILYCVILVILFALLWFFYPVYWVYFAVVITLVVFFLFFDLYSFFNAYRELSEMRLVIDSTSVALVSTEACGEIPISSITEIKWQEKLGEVKKIKLVTQGYGVIEIKNYKDMDEILCALRRLSKPLKNSPNMG